MNDLGRKLNISAWKKAQLFCQIADEKKVQKIVVLNVESLTPIVYYFVIGTCENYLHLGAVADEMVTCAKKKLNASLRRSGEPRSNWVILDANDVIVHLFNHQLRDYYDLETLWAKAEKWTWSNGKLKPEKVAV